MNSSSFIGCVLRNHKCYAVIHSGLLSFVLEIRFICERAGEKQRLQEPRQIFVLGYSVFTDLLRDVKTCRCPSVCLWSSHLV